MSIFSEFFGHPVNNQTLAGLIVSHLPSSSWHTWHSCVLWKYRHFTFSPTWLKINSETCHSHFNFGSEWRKMLGLERQSFIYYLAPLLMNYSSNINCLMVSYSRPLIGSWAIFNLLIGQNCLSFHQSLYLLVQCLHQASDALARVCRSRGRHKQKRKNGKISCIHLICQSMEN